MTHLIAALLAAVCLLPLPGVRLALRFPLPVTALQADKPVRLKAAKDCRCFVGGKEVTYAEFMRVGRTVTLIEQDGATGEVIRLEADE